MGLTKSNPLLAEAWAGLKGSGQVHLSYFNYLLLQAAVLLLWWPKSTLIGWLESESAPNTLLAVVLAVGVTVAYYSLRAGAEELLLPGQHSLWEWVLSTKLRLGRILYGYFCAHILQTLHAIMLSSPILLMGYAVAGNAWSGLVWSVTAIIFQATFFRLLGAVMYMLIGHYEHIMFLSLRAALVVGYLLIGTLLSITGQMLPSASLLSGDIVHSDYGMFAGVWRFLLVNTVLCLLFGCVFYLMLARRRRLPASPAAADKPEEPGRR